MTDLPEIDEAGWRPMDTAPFQTVIEVRNPQMDAPCFATRGFVHKGMVHHNLSYCTTIYTPGQFDSTPGGRLCCPTEWRPVRGGAEE